MTILWRAFIPLVSHRLPECPTWTIKDEALLAAIEFVNDSRAWRDAAPISLGDTAASQSDYALSPVDANTDAFGVCEAWLGDTRLAEPTTAESISQGVDPSPEREASGTPRTIRVVARATVRLYPTPDAGGETLRVMTAWRPGPAATGLPDALFYAYRDAIQWKMMERLLLHKGKPWSDPMGAGDARRQYDVLALRHASEAGSAGRRPRQVRQVI